MRSAARNSVDITTRALVVDAEASAQRVDQLLDGRADTEPGPQHRTGAVELQVARGAQVQHRDAPIGLGPLEVVDAQGQPAALTALTLLAASSDTVHS